MPKDFKGQAAGTEFQRPGQDMKRFRIAFSLAGEKRGFVEKLAAILAKKFGEAAILYDKFHEAEFANWKLGLLLQEHYHDHSDLIVVVVCPDYTKKDWCGLEWVAIHGMLMSGKDREIMLCRFERAKLQGINENAGFVELDHKTPEQAATLILERLAINEGNPRDYYSENGEPPKTSIPNNLPRLPSFYGRADELKKIADALLPSARTWGALIDGPGGIGKTSLAIKAAEAIPPGHFKRILFLSAKEREMSADGERKLTGFVLPGYLEMLNEIARLLGQPGFAESLEADRARRILVALTSEQALLILDNLERLPKEDLNQLYTFLSRLPQGCKAIVTSGRRTDIDARIIRLEKMAHDAALAFLADLATDRKELAKASEAERIQLYEETGGNPLLMRWIVGQLGRGKCRTVAATLAFIRGAPAGNDPLEFIFGDLLEELTESETKVLAALTYFTRAMELKFIAELASLSQPAAQTALGDLASRALVVPDEPEENFALVPMVADFLRRKRPEVVAETCSRLEQRAYALIVENGYDKYDRFRVLDANWPTVAPALPLFLAGPNPRLQTVCAALRFFLEFTSRWDEWLSLEQQAETKAAAAGDHNNAGWRAYQQGWVYYLYQRYVYYLRKQADPVLACADRAAAHWQTAKAGARERGFAIRLRGLGHKLKRDYPAAMATYREALDLHRSLSAETEDVAIALYGLAGAERLSGDLVEAELDYREALRIARKAGHAEGVATYTGNLAELALAQEDWPGAETLAREALRLSENVGRQELIAIDCHRLAKALVRQGKPAEARPYAQRAVDICTRLGHPDLEDARAILAECEG